MTADILRFAEHADSILQGTPGYTGIHPEQASPPDEHGHVSIPIDLQGVTTAHVCYWPEQAPTRYNAVDGVIQGLRLSMYTTPPSNDRRKELTATIDRIRNYAQR